MYRRDSLNSELVDAVPAYPSKDGCINRVPYSSVMAFVMCIIGSILFATMIWSFNASIEQARRALDITNIPWLEQVHLAFIILAVLMAIFSLFLLLIGVLSTGSTREEIYKRKDSRRGGRIICAIAIVVSYLLNILWILIVSITAILSFIYYIFSRLCSSLQEYSENTCLDFDVFKPLVQQYSNPDLKLCGGNVQQFCAVTNTVFSWNIVGFIGALIIVLGLVQFIASNASNYAHVNNEQRYIELKEVLYMEGVVGRDFIPPPQPPVRAYPSPPTVPPPRARKSRPFDYRDESTPSRRRERERSLPRNTTQGMGSVRRNMFIVAVLISRFVQSKKMGRTQQRPKSKEEKLRARRKHILDEPVRKELFLDKGGEEDIQTDEDDGDDEDMPEEISTKKSEQSEHAPLPEKKKKKRKVKREGPGIYQVQTE
uniref:Uncharacterized protein n=1 Tax=Panagrolaimus superbus TaxID=310955 RepID=A0A914XZE3_9BILA